MNKTTLVLILIFTLLMTACTGNASNAAGPASSSQGGPAAGELSTSVQVALGTLKLDGTENVVTSEQAAELLPLWQTLEVLYNSDTAATQEIDALIAQIQDMLTDEQTQAIAALNLTRQDMMSVLQDQGLAMGGAQSGTVPSENSTTNSGGGGGFVPGEFPQGGPGGGGPDFQGQRPQTTDSTDNATRPTVTDPNRIPTVLVQAVIEYLKEKVGS